MKKLIIVLFLCVNICCQVFAEPADPTLHAVIQPNGDTIYISLRGDEYGSWYEDERGNIIDVDSNNYWVYVSVENNNKVLTNQIVSQISMPIDINRDSVFNFVLQKRENNYIEQKEITEGQANSRAVTGKLTPLPSTGVQKILTVLVQFTDVKFQNQTGIKNLVTNMMNQSNYKHPGQNNITGSLRDFYLQASYNQLDVRATVIGPYTVSHNMAYYGAKTDSENDKNRRKLAREVMEMIADDIDVSQFDNNNDGWVECIHILFAGYAQNDSWDYGSDDAIWPHQWNLATYVSADGVKMSRYVMTPELNGPYYRGVGTICHELGHILGAPDFYDVKNDVFQGTGKFDLMCDGNWNKLATCPAHPNPYIKTEIFGWIKTIDELSGNDSLYTLRPTELDSSGIYKLSTSTQGEYYLLENRQDENLKGTGLVIYHVNSGIENVATDEINIKHPQNLYVVDASNNLAKPTGSVASYGTINSSNATYKNTPTNNIFFTSQTKPSNCDWAGNVTQNKDVCFISEEEIDGEMCIKFVLNPEIEGPDVLCDSAVYSIKHVPADATIEWTYVAIPGLILPNVPVRIGSGQGTMEVCYKRGIKLEGGAFQDTTEIPDAPFLPVPASVTPPTFVPYVGDVTLKVNITFNGNTHSLFKTITMPKVAKEVEIAELNFGSLNVWCKGVTKTLTLKASAEEEWMNDVRWDIELPGIAPYSVYGSLATITPTATGRATIIASHSNACGESQSDTAIYQIVQILGTSFVNPVSGSVEISIIGGDELNGNSNISTVALDNQTSHACRLELWHDVYGKVREMDVPENTLVVTMDLGGLTSGIYVLRLIVDNQIIETSQMIIK